MTSKNSFDQDLVRQLATILNETDLTEIEYEMDGCRVRVARTVNVTHVAQATAPMMHAMAAPAAAPVEPTPAAPLDLSKNPGSLKSPMVGNAYLSPAPGADSFVKIGDKVTKGQSVLIIEAMKVMNQIKAHKDGVVKQVLISSGEPVEFDQVLMLIED